MPAKASSASDSTPTVTSVCAPDFARACASVLEQRRLSNACLAADHECPTPIVDTIDKGTDVIRLGVTPDQLGAQA